MLRKGVANLGNNYRVRGGGSGCARNAAARIHNQTNSKANLRDDPCFSKIQTVTEADTNASPL